MSCKWKVPDQFEIITGKLIRWKSIHFIYKGKDRRKNKLQLWKHLKWINCFIIFKQIVPYQISPLEPFRRHFSACLCLQCFCITALCVSAQLHFRSLCTFAETPMSLTKPTTWTDLDTVLLFPDPVEFILLAPSLNRVLFWSATRPTLCTHPTSTQKH